MALMLATPAKIRERVQYYASLDEPTTFSHGVAGAIVGAFNYALSYGNVGKEAAARHRREVWGFLLTKDDCTPMEFHSQGLAPMEWNALFRWMGGSWQSDHMRPQFVAECRWVYDWAAGAFRLARLKPGLTMAEIITIAINVVAEDSVPERAPQPLGIY